jgi:hypothetical protein
LGSKLGTTVNGAPIQDRGEWRLHSGDVIALGDTTMRVTATPPSPSPKPPPVPPPPAADAGTEFHIEIALDVNESVPVPALRPGLEVERRLALFLELAPQFGVQTTLEGLLQFILRRVMDVIPAAERGAVLLHGPNDRELLVKACVSPDGPAVSGTLAQRALAQRHGFIWRRNLAGGAVSDSIIIHRIATGIYVPLLWQEDTLGVICIDSSRPAAVFNRDDLRLLIAVAHYTTVALRGR